MIVLAKNIYLDLPSTKMQIDINVSSVNEMAKDLGFPEITQDVLEEKVDEFMLLQDYIENNRLSKDDELDYVMARVKDIIWGSSKPVSEESSLLEDCYYTLGEVLGVTVKEVNSEQYLDLLKFISDNTTFTSKTYTDLDDLKADILVKVSEVISMSKKQFPLRKEVKKILGL